MGRLTEEDRAEIVADAAEKGDEEAARAHGTSVKQIERMRESLARGEPVSGVGKVSPNSVADLLQRRIEDAQAKAALKAAEAVGRLCEDDTRDHSQKIMATVTAMKTLHEIQESRRWMQAEMAQLEERRRQQAERRRALDAEFVEEPRGLTGKPEDEP